MFTRSVCFLTVAVSVAITSVTFAFQEAQPSSDEKAPKLETPLEKASYAVGYNIGKDLKRQGLDLNPKTIALGIAASLAGEKSALTDQEIAQVFGELRDVMLRRESEKVEKNLKAGQKFLAENAKKEGVKTTKSGLQYLVIKEGTGATPTTNSTVTTHYRGTLVDGTVFDSSYAGDRPAADDEPVSFGVTQVIKGWTEALQMMKVGSHYKLFIPSQLAYGENGPGEIGPNSTLIFEIFLIDSRN